VSARLPRAHQNVGRLAHATVAHYGQPRRLRQHVADNVDLLRVDVLGVTTDMEAPVTSSGCGVRVAVTTTVSGAAAARPGAKAQSKATDENKKDLCMTFSWFEPGVGTREAPFMFCRMKSANTKAPRGDDFQLLRRDGFPPQSPAHPTGNRTTAQGRFPGFRFFICVRLPKGIRLSGSWTYSRRLQLRGQPRYRTAFPKPHA